MSDAVDCGFLECWTYVLGEPEAVPVDLAVLQVELLVELDVEVAPDVAMFRVQSVTDLTVEGRWRL